MGKWRYLPSSPLHLDIELSYACNFKCVMCPQAYDTAHKGQMDWKLAANIVHQAAEMGVHSIKWNWRGEATLHKQIAALTALAKAEGIPNVELNTNGNMRGCKVEDLCRAGIDRLIFSVDGATKKTFESIRIGGSFEELRQTIWDTINWKMSHRSEKPYIRVQMCKQKANAHEVEAFIKQWKGEVDDIRVSQVTDRGADGFLHVGDLVAYERAFCQQPYQRLTIGYNGTVMGCCADWFENAPVGVANKESLADIWRKSVDLQVMRDAQIEGNQDHIKPCDTCWAKDGYHWKPAEIVVGDGNFISLFDFMAGKDKHTHGKSAQLVNAKQGGEK